MIFESLVYRKNKTSLYATNRCSECNGERKIYKKYRFTYVPLELCTSCDGEGFSFVRYVKEGDDKISKDKIIKRDENWKNKFFNNDGSAWVVLDKISPVRKRIKELGGVYEPLLKLWLFKTKPLDESLTLKKINLNDFFFYYDDKKGKLLDKDGSGYYLKDTVNLNKSYR